MITHDADSLYNICDRIAILIDGHIIIGTMDEILANPHPWIQQYFNTARYRKSGQLKGNEHGK